MTRAMMNCSMRSLKRPWLLLCLTTLLALTAQNASATDFCVAISGGFGSGGTPLWARDLSPRPMERVSLGRALLRPPPPW